MVSLTTVYIVSVLLTSIAVIVSSFAAKKIVGGSAPSPIPLGSPSVPPYQDQDVPIPPPSTEQIEPEVVSQPE